MSSEHNDRPRGKPRSLELTMQLESLGDDSLFELLRTEFLRLEEHHYRNGLVLPAEAKLLFLVGTEKLDITQAETKLGLSIYTKAVDHVKAPEITEATSAITDHFEREKNIPRVMSEIADLYYNLIQLTKLDKDFAPSYQRCIDEVCAVIGYTHYEAYLLTLLKYKKRLIDNEGEKNFPDELAFIEKQMATQLEASMYFIPPMNEFVEKMNQEKYRRRERIIAAVGPAIETQHKLTLPCPSEKALNEVYKLLNDMKTTILVPRLQQLQKMNEWKKNAWESGNSYLFQPTNIIASEPYSSRETESLLHVFQEALQPKTDVVVNLSHDGDMSYSRAIKTTQNVISSHTLAVKIAELGFRAHCESTDSFKMPAHVDILILPEEFLQTSEVLTRLSGATYILTPQSNVDRIHPGYTLLGVLTQDRDTQHPVLDRTRKEDYRTEVTTDREFRHMSSIVKEIDSDDETLTYPEVEKFVQETAGESKNILQTYKASVEKVTKGFRAKTEPDEETLALTDALMDMAVDWDDLHLPFKRYGGKTTFYVYQHKES